MVSERGKEETHWAEVPEREGNACVLGFAARPIQMLGQWAKGGELGSTCGLAHGEGKRAERGKKSRPSRGRVWLGLSGL